MKARRRNWWRHPRVTAADRKWAAYVRALPPPQQGPHLICGACDVWWDGPCPVHGHTYLRPCDGPSVPGRRGCCRCNDERRARLQRSA